MQLVNDLGMLAIVHLRRGDLSSLLFVLVLIVLSLGMLVLKRYAEMRSKLEILVDERADALRRKSLELERQATHDNLTGLLNRRYADDYLQREI